MRRRVEVNVDDDESKEEATALHEKTTSRRAFSSRLKKVSRSCLCLTVSSKFTCLSRESHDASCIGPIGPDGCLLMLDAKKSIHSLLLTLLSLLVVL